MPLTLVLVIALTQASLAPDSGEVHLRNLRQLTFGGQNAEAYFSAAGRLLIFQRQGPDEQCDQMYVMGADAPRAATSSITIGGFSTRAPNTPPRRARHAPIIHAATCGRCTTTPSTP